LIAGPYTGSFGFEGDDVPKTAYIEIYCHCGAGEFQITVNGKPVASINSGELRDVARKIFDLDGRGSGPTVAYQLDVAFDDHPYATTYSLQSLTTGAVEAASGCNEVTKF
jgi:hypothetical protein